MVDPARNLQKNRLMYWVIPRVFIIILPFLLGILVSPAYGLLVGILFLTAYVAIIEGNLNRVFKWQR